MNIENLHDLLVDELGSKYILGEKVFEAKNFTVYIATHRGNKLTYNQLVLIKNLCNEKPTVHIWDKKISTVATKMEITKEVTEAIQAGFKKQE
ncbi:MULTISPECIES: hypothetical protein [Bacillus]|uniref:hypothetical protein n=1 Tax=Bacillus TaxID=1386 RepID=UPI00032E8F74|nr:hypothetical protein ICS_03842 [Bacillus cereus BAG2O-3]EOQ13676.1 hypothetical protein KQ3_01042 [Bacillus cereus B5-2]MBJ8115068.1 hypothetical protein [Bacillus cereus]PFW86376.1 hypothetical protein COL27_03940 [Bacillus sp. AFS075960]RFB14022.1 hypothetical protein DZB88_09000 [Bacillus sp. OE]RFB27156.1 hypothetical protein DZB85_02830 [Bacillus sp. LB(2018)]RFB48051.1 hypothetical protein DZB83_12600 [Bacillus sp. dmp10]